ncbi:hypothetical protein ES703_19869 [subsurface metagenome]
MENVWYKEEWATELMGVVAGSIFAEPEPSLYAGYQLPPIKTGLGFKAEFGDWAPVVMVIGIVALILLFLFLRR